MKLKNLRIKGFKNLTGIDGWFTLDFTNKDGITVLIGNNGSGKSNVLEAISAIFIGLYKIGTPQRKPTFSYVIEYSIGEEPSIEIKLKLINGTYGFYINNEKKLRKDFIESADIWLPSKVIASYSGEEIRLWNTYYKYSYSDFITSVKSNELRSLPEQKLFYIDSGYWNEALIVFLLSELGANQSFILNKLGIVSIESIVFKFNTNNISKYQSNLITNFIRRLNPYNRDTISISFEDFKTFVVEYEYDLFIKLISSSKSELITNITINFNGNLTTEALSEGQKKQILIRAILEFLSDQKTIILLDEPDSHIHVANKLQFKNMLEEYEHKNLIFTSHSPTLMNIFDRHLEYLENGEIKGKVKAEILKEISADTMSDAQRQILLNANTDILIVEGKTDEIFISEALRKLKPIYPEYENLDFNYLYLGGSDPEILQGLIRKFPPKEGQTIVAFFDRDEAGLKAIKDVCNYTGNTDNFNGQIVGGIRVYFYPKKVGYPTSKFEVEDYFDITKCRDFTFTNITNFASLKKGFSKIDFARECTNFSAQDFEGFKSLFNLLINIKGL